MNNRKSNPSYPEEGEIFGNQIFLNEKILDGI